MPGFPPLIFVFPIPIPRVQRMGRKPPIWSTRFGDGKEEAKLKNASKKQSDSDSFDNLPRVSFTFLLLLYIYDIQQYILYVYCTLHVYSANLSIQPLKPKLSQKDFLPIFLAGERIFCNVFRVNKWMKVREREAKI
jgi:hypothetical protein